LLLKLPQRRQSARFNLHSNCCHPEPKAKDLQLPFETSASAVIRPELASTCLNCFCRVRMNLPITLESISAWFAAKGSALAQSGVTIAETASRTEHVPAARADFDSICAIGRISFWTTGEVDFEVLDRTTERLAFFRHESVSSFDSPQLEEAYVAFIDAMAGDHGPGER